MEKLKICFISKEYPPESHMGGIGTYTYIASTALAEQGHQVHVICCTKGKEKSLMQEGVHVHRIPVHPFLLNPHRLFYPVRLLKRKMSIQFLENQAWSYGAAEALRKLMVDTGIQVVEYAETNAEGYYAAKLKGIGKVCRLHIGGFAESASNLNDNFYSRYKTRNLEASSIRNADQITCPSRALADYTAEDMKLPRDKIIVFPNPMDPEYINIPPQPKNQFEQHLLFVGRIERRKGVEILLSAFVNLINKFPETKLRLIGHDYGHYYDPVKKKDIIKELLEKYNIKDQVEFISRIGRDELIHHFKWADALVVPSINENLPYVVLEGMSRGKLVIASDCGGIPEMIRHDETGMLFPTGDIAGLTTALIRAWENPDRINDIGEAARAAVKNNYSPFCILPHLLKAYKEAVKR